LRDREVWRLRIVPAATLVAVAALALVPLATGEGCLPFCEVPSHTTGGFVPPVTLVGAGSTLTWTSLDTLPHTASATTLDLCLHVTYSKTSPGSARFDILDGTLVVTMPGMEPKVCTGAEALPDRSLRLDYVCFYHPNTMNGTLLVK
jgi:plastocyanin